MLYLSILWEGIEHMKDSIGLTIKMNVEEKHGPITDEDLKKNAGL